jgi:hypothetical protein
MIRALLLRMPEWLERLMLGAPLRLGPTGELALSLGGKWDRDAVFALVNVYMDEAGTHGSSPHLIMGALVGRLGQWLTSIKSGQRCFVARG